MAESKHRFSWEQSPCLALAQHQKIKEARIIRYGLLGPAHKAANLAAARVALEAPAPDPVVVESVEAFMRRVAGIEWLNCPHCHEGRFHVVQAIPPHLPRAPPGRSP